MTDGALTTAQSEFGLTTKRRVIEFVRDQGLENLHHANTARLEKSFDPTVEILVDSYDFTSGPLYGYIAFFLSPQTQKWVIKSFKKNEKPDPRNLALAGPLQRLLDQAKK